MIKRKKSPKKTSSLSSFFPPRWKKGSLLTLFTAACLFLGEWLVEKTTLPPTLPDEGEGVALYSTQSGDDLEAVFLKAINSAEQSLFLAIYSLNDKKILSALRARAEAGVTVHVVVDAKASPNVSEQLGAAVTLVKRTPEGLMHLKLLVVDGKLSFLGSANLTEDSLRMQSNLVAALPSRALSTVIQKKITSLHETTRSELFPSTSYLLNGEEATLFFLPDTPQAVEAIKKLIQTAKKTIKVGMFTWTREDLAREIIAAKQRGVHIEVIFDHYSGKGTSAKIVDLLKKNQILCYLAKPQALFHHKMIYSDDGTDDGATLAFGSANWTQAAFKQNDDDLFILKKLPPDQKQKIETLWRIARREATRV